MNKDSKIYIAGHRGMVGSAIVRELQRQGYTNLITRTHAQLDLCRQADVEAKKALGWNPAKTSFEQLVKLMVQSDMKKVAADHAAEQARVNLAEYLEKGIVK